jgi:hypothetical protein
VAGSGATIVGLEVPGYGNSVIVIVKLYRFLAQAEEELARAWKGGRVERRRFREILRL